MCDQNDEITNRNGQQVNTIMAMLTIISCMIPAELIKSVSRNNLNSLKH